VRCSAFLTRSETCSLCNRQHGFSTPLTSNEWMSVLKLSTIWGFHAVRSTAIENLSAFATDDPVLKVIVAKKYSVVDWLVPALNALAQRNEPLGYADFERFKDIGTVDYVVDFLLRLAQVREKITSTQYCSYHASYTCSCYTRTLNRSGHDFTASIRDVFASDITASNPGDGSMSSTPSPLGKKKKKKSGL
jgi:hypothetical protein